MRFSEISNALAPITQSFKPYTHFKKFIFIDRDGTLNEDSGYISYPHPVVLTEQIRDLATQLDVTNLGFIVVSNQSGISRGIFSKLDLDKFNSILFRELDYIGVKVVSSISCPHSSLDNCLCRKPGTLMFELATSLWVKDKPLLGFVGNSETDEAAASNANLVFFDIRKPGFIRELEAVIS